MARVFLRTIGLSALVAAGPLYAAAPEGVPARAGTRLQAATILSGGGATPVPCLSPFVAAIRLDPQHATPAARRALAALIAEAGVPAERRWPDASGTVVRYTTDRGAIDRIESADADGDGRPDLVAAALQGLDDARRLLTTRMDFPSPSPFDVVLARLGAGIEGVYLAGAGRDGRGVMVLDAATRPAAEALRRAAAHQYAHAVASSLGPAASDSWGEALAVWTEMMLEANADERALGWIGRRVQRLAAGLDADDLELAAGNAAWLAFLNDAYGPTAMRLAFDELARGGAFAPAMDRALRRGVGVGFETAFREFQLWALLTGERDDRRHFAFAARLPSPSFASTAEGLPSMAVQADPAVAGLGAAMVGLRPEDGRGGMRVRFEGEAGGRWAADLVLVRPGLPLYRVAIPLLEGRGEITVPLDGLREAVLLVRSLDSDSRLRRYSWSAVRDAAWPVEIGGVNADRDADSGAVALRWDTLSEAGTLGFNVVRRRADGAGAVRVNPVWVPAVGDRSSPAEYRFVDTTAEPGVAYVYRVEAVTAEGLTTLSEPVDVPAPR